MSAPTDLLHAPVSELAALVRGGQVAARELAEAALERIEAVNPRLNAFIEVDADGALEAAGDIEPGDERPFAGVPIAIKANTPVAGRLVTYGSRFLQDNRPGHSAYLVRRLREAGFVIVGMTNLPEFGILPTSESRHHGPVRNPWDLERTPGGSSGGAAAAVAAGMVPVAHGNDGGGSIRIPAACTGTVGLKPSRGRISRGPDLGDSFLGADGVLTRTVGDTAQLLDVLAGYEVGDATWAPRPVEPYANVVRREPDSLRIACTAANPLDADVDPVCMQALQQTGELLSSMGHRIEDAAPAWPGDGVLELFIAIFGPSVSLGVAYGQARAGRPPTDDEIEPLTRAVYERAQATSSVGYLGAMAQLQAVARAIVAFFAGYDVLLTPALAERPLPIGECHGCGDEPVEDLRRSGLFTPFTSIFNVTGQPAITVPVGFGPDGLPTSVQLVGKPLAEDTLLQLAAQIEAARPWAHNRPSDL